MAAVAQIAVGNNEALLQTAGTATGPEAEVEAVRGVVIAVVIADTPQDEAASPITEIKAVTAVVVTIILEVATTAGTAFRTMGTEAVPGVIVRGTNILDQQGVLRRAGVPLRRHATTGTTTGVAAACARPHRRRRRHRLRPWWTTRLRARCPWVGTRSPWRICQPICLG